MRRVPTVDNLDKCEGCMFNSRTEHCSFPGEKEVSINGWNPRQCVQYGNDDILFHRVNYIYLSGLDISKETIII